MGNNLCDFVEAIQVNLIMTVAVDILQYTCVVKWDKELKWFNNFLKTRT